MDADTLANSISQIELHWLSVRTISSHDGSCFAITQRELDQLKLTFNVCYRKQAAAKGWNVFSVLTAPFTGAKLDQLGGALYAVLTSEWLSLSAVLFLFSHPLFSSQYPTHHLYPLIRTSVISINYDAPQIFVINNWPSAPESLIIACSSAFGALLSSAFYDVSQLPSLRCIAILLALQPSLQRRLIC